MDDDATVLAVIGHMLRDSFPGPIFFAATPEEAAEVWKAPESNVDILITDLSLEGESGERVGAEFVRFNPSGRVVIVTGWDLDEEENNRVVGWPVSVLRKPFTAADLQEALRPLMGRTN